MTSHSNFLSSLPPRPRRARPPKITPLIQVLSSVATSTPGGGEGKRVVIDGVIFQFEQGGKKLARIGGMLRSFLTLKRDRAEQTLQSFHRRLAHLGPAHRPLSRRRRASRSSTAARSSEEPIGVIWFLPHRGGSFCYVVGRIADSPLQI